jgi:hypothetical protein
VRFFSAPTCCKESPHKGGAVLWQCSKALGANLCHASVDVREGSRIGPAVHVHLHSSNNHTQKSKADRLGLPQGAPSQLFVAWCAVPHTCAEYWPSQTCTACNNMAPRFKVRPLACSSHLPVSNRHHMHHGCILFFQSLPYAAPTWPVWKNNMKHMGVNTAPSSWPTS